MNGHTDLESMAAAAATTQTIQDRWDDDIEHDDAPDEALE